MKFFIVGLHGSGKRNVAEQLEEMGLKYGRLFSNGPCNNPAIYNYNNFEEYDNNDINDVFENKAYIFIHEHLDNFSLGSLRYFEGLSKYTFDNNDVFIISPDQLLSIPETHIPNDVVYVVLDNTLSKRKDLYRMEKRTYDFVDRERLETVDIKEYMKILYNMAGDKILYFTNEETERVAAIIYAIYTHPDLLNTFTKNFN